MKKDKGFAPIIIALVVVIVLAVGGAVYYFGTNSSVAPDPINENKVNFPVVDRAENDQFANKETGSSVADNSKINNDKKSNCLSTTPWIKVLSPNGGEVFTVGQKIIVKWESCNVPVGVDIGINLLNQTDTKPLTQKVYSILKQTPNDGSELVGLLSQDNMGPFHLGNFFKISLDYVFTADYTGPWDNDGHMPLWSNLNDSSDGLFMIKNNSSNDQSSSFQSSDTKVDGVSCHNREKYFVLNKDRVGEVGEDILVKYKTSPNQVIDCKYVVEKNDFELPKDSFNVMYVEKNNLIIDAGTSASRRDIVVYNLDTRKQVFRDGDDGGFKKTGDIITYWGFPKTTSSALGCKTDEILVEYFSFDLSTYTKKDLGESKCEYTE